MGIKFNQQTSDNIPLPKRVHGVSIFNLTIHNSSQVIFSQTSELLERQSSMASSTEEVSGTNDLSTDSKQHDTTDTEQKFGMYMREFDFLEYELESLEVSISFHILIKLFCRPKIG